VAYKRRPWGVHSRRRRLEVSKVMLEKLLRVLYLSPLPLQLFISPSIGEPKLTYSSSSQYFKKSRAKDPSLRRV